MRRALLALAWTLAIVLLAPRASWAPLFNPPLPGSLLVNEDSSTVATNPSAFNFIEPDATLVTESPGGTARVDMSKYVLLGGRSGGQTITGNITETGTLTVQGASAAFGTAGTSFSGSMGQGGTGSATATLQLKAGSGGGIAALDLVRNTTVFAEFGYDGAQTYLQFDPNNPFNFNAGIGTTVVSIDSSGDVTADGYVAAANTATAPTTSYTIPTGYRLETLGTQYLTGTTHAVARGTGRTRMWDEHQDFAGAFSPGSYTLASGKYRIYARRQYLEGKAHVRLLGTATVRGIS